MSELKIVDRTSLADICRTLRNAGRKIIFTNGCFDILHPGHVAYLEDAKALGNILIVGMNTDASVQRLKGPKRPINPQMTRALVMAGLAAVDYVCFFDEDTPVELIQELQPSIHTKGGDYTPQSLPEYESIIAYGGDVTIIPFRPGLSSSSVIETILERYCSDFAKSAPK
jgi:D-beta-D-heptose 7-phosphate kinase/D-beta-D-heptose 1-phosphate adenosyltransferase